MPRNSDPQFLHAIITQLPVPARTYAVGGEFVTVVIPNIPFKNLVPEDFRYKFDTINQKKMLFALVLYAYPHATANELISWAVHKLSLSDIDIVQISVAMNCMAISKKVATHFYNPGAFRSFFLREKVTPHFKAIIAHDEYRLFKDAAQNGNLDILKWLKEIAADEFLQMIRAVNYAPFDYAARYGHFHILKWLAKQAPAELPNMVQAFNYAAFRFTAAEGRLDVLKWMQEILPNHFLDMIRAENFNAFHRAVIKKHPPVIEWLLETLECFAYAEAHVFEYGDIMNPYLNQILSSLRQRSLAHLGAEPFNVSVEEAKRCFYVLRNLIRRNDADVHDDIVFLLNISAVRCLVHTEITVGRSNELLRLALSVGNESAAAALLNISPVRELAERCNYYRNERVGGLDLSALAQDRESSMHALSIGEQKRLKAANDYYQPVLQNKGVSQIIEDLRQNLITYYEKNPALLTKDNGTCFGLPASWANFQKLSLSPAERERANIAYYQNTNHSALRYLSKPNHWMHKEASYVSMDENNPQNKWSAYVEYQPLIAMFWLAAQDKDFPLLEGHTLAGRIELFIKELSLIGRAHNWDKTRTRKDKPDEKEEYDDLQGDRPSCYSGMKRRLFQSVIGHPLLKLLSKEDIKQEIREFALDYFKQKIMLLNNKNTLRISFEQYVYEADEDSPQPLACLNIPPKDQDDFLMYLHKKYSEQFSTDPNLIALVRDTLRINPHSKVPSERYHALKLDGLTHLLFYLQQEEQPPESEQIALNLKNQKTQPMKKFYVHDRTIGLFTADSSVVPARIDSASEFSLQ